MEEFKQRIIELREELNAHNRRYYVDNSPSISDYEYDMLMNELIALEKEHPELVTDDSPTRRVGSDLETSSGAAVTREFRRVAHRYPMLSLGNTYNSGELHDFVTKASRDVPHPLDFCCELKFDGTAICLTYRGGRLVSALTRGDGAMGDDVLENVRQIKCIPSRLTGTGYPEEFEIRGEIFMPYKAFDRLCLEREEEGEPPFANPRNAASGSLKLLDSAEVGRRGLECTLYHILGENLPFETHDEALKAAASWGLPVSEHRKLCNTIDEIDAFIEYWDTERKLLPFPTDGVVVKVNGLAVQKELGFTSKCPRWAVAYKFKAEQALAEVLGIDYQVGRTGAVTPVANLSPVPLSGTMVKRATLHNAEQMEALDIRIGDWVYVEKGGEIIPKITSVELSRRPILSTRPDFPDRCPDCGTPLVREADQAKWFCPNVWGCPTQVKESLVHFLSRKAMNVLAGDATVAQLYDLGLVRCSADFYDLTFADLYRLEGWKEKSCERFLKSLDDSRKVGFDHVLFALGIRNVGETTAKMLARHFGDIDSLSTASVEELTAVGDIGEIIASSIVSFFREPRNVENISRLKAAGIRFSMEEMTPGDNVLEGLTFVITGTYSISREEMKNLVERHGGKTSGSVSSKTSFLLAGENPGPEKVRKAGELGVRTITEDDFYAMAGEKNVMKQEKELTLF